MIRTLIKKDLMLKMKNPVGFLLLMALPLAFTFLMGAIFTSSSKQQVLPNIKVLLEDHDNSLMSNMIGASFRNNQMAEMFTLVPVGPDSGRAMMDEGQASALLIIPEGFQDSLIAQSQTELVLVKNPSEAFLPKITEETVRILAEGTDKLFRMTGSELSTLETILEKEEWPQPNEIALLYVQFRDLIENVRAYLFPLLIEIQTETLKNADDTPQNTGNQTFAYILAGIAAMSLLFVLEALGRDYFREQEHKTMYRIISSSAGIKKFILAKQSFIAITGIITFSIVWIIGVVLFGIRIQITDLPGFALISILMICAFTGIIGFLFAISKNRGVSSSINSAVIIFFSIVGGGMLPLQALPTFMKKMAVISPVYWGVDGLQKILIDHANWQQIGMHMIILLALVLLFNSLAFGLFLRKSRS